MRVYAVIFALVTMLAPAAAGAEARIGVLVTGDYLKGPTTQQSQAWLQSHGHKVITRPMPKDAVKILLDCFVLDDPKCMRSVVDARSTTDTLVSIRIDVASRKNREIRLTMDWFVKGHSPVSLRRTCDGCTEKVLRSTIDAMLEDLARSAPGQSGRVSITSTPDGITVLLDNATIGVTPIERDVPAGEHKVQLVRDGHTGEAKMITVKAGTKTDVTLAPPARTSTVSDAPPPPPSPTTPAPARRSRLVPGLLIGIGVAAGGAGAALYFTSEEPTGQGRTYRDTKNLGIGVAAGGGALLLTGVIVILATRSSSTPTIGMTPGGATVGWAGRF